MEHLLNYTSVVSWEIMILGDTLWENNDLEQFFCFIDDRPKAQKGSISHQRSHS
jgi:hypothetical protein